MALRAGFFNSINGDRKYYASDWSDLMNLLINNGVLANFGDTFTVTAQGGLYVTVGTGTGWFNSKWVTNNSEYGIYVDTPGVINSRKDYLCLVIDDTDSVRAPDIRWVSGEPSTSPVYPSLPEEDGVEYVILAGFTISANATDITQSSVENFIGTSTTPYVTGILETANIDSVFAQWDADFNEWYASVVDILSDDQAYNLSVKIDSVQASLESSMSESAAILNSRIDNIIANSGDTGDNSELIDIRVGYDGVTYDTAGAAVRGQIVEAIEQTKLLGVNLFNKEDYSLEGMYINALANYGSNTAYNISSYIPVEVGNYFFTGYTSSVVKFETYNQNKTAVRIIVSEDATPLTIEEGEAFIRLTVRLSDESITQFEAGSEATPIRLYYTRDSVIENVDNITTLTRGLYSKLDKILSKNLFSSVYSASGKYISLSGLELMNELYNISEYIAVETGDYTYTGWTSNNACFQTYDAYFTPKRVFPTSTANPISITDDEKYIRLSTHVDYESITQFEAGSEATEYEPYYGYKPVYDNALQIAANVEAIELIKNSGIFKTKNAERIAMSEITINEIYTLPSPKDIKFKNALSLYCTFDSFTGTIIFGKGKTSYNGRFFEITSENVILKSYVTAESTLSTVAHGLTLDTFMQVHVVQVGLTLQLTVNTLTGYFEYSFSFGNEINGSPFFTSSFSVENVSFSYYNDSYSENIWIFGDSYFGVNTSRVMGWLNEWTDLPFVNGLSGQGSSGAYTNLIQSLENYTPKMIVWCVGMNDGYSTWSTYYSLLKNICEANDIELVLYRCPCVPARDRTEMNADVIASGYRYIDAYKAVGSDDSGTWFDGYLDTDEVHPTSLGARALAAQFLVDVPELLRG